MKTVQISKHVWALETWVGFPIRVWAVIDETGVTLVDAGVSFMARPILSLAKHFGGLRQIVLTHGHPDHVGAIKLLLRQHPVPVYLHPIEIPYAEGDLAYPSRRRAQANLPKGVAQPFPDELGSLTAHLTPGHSPGHAAYYHEEDDVLLAGDLFTAKRGQLRPPMRIFTSDMAEAFESSAIIDKLKPKQLEVSHGGSVNDPVAQLAGYRLAHSPSASMNLAK